MTKLEIKYNFLLNRQAQFESLLCLLGSLTTSINELDFRNNHLDRLDIGQLEQIFAAIPTHIRILSLCENHLGEKLFSVFKSIPLGVEELNLTQNQLIRFDQNRMTELFLTLPSQVQSLSLDYQDVSLHLPYFSDGIRELHLSRSHHLIENFALRQRFYNKLPAAMNWIYLAETLWLFSIEGKKLAELIKPESERLIVYLENLEFSTLKHHFLSLPKHIKYLDLDFSEPDYLAFQDLSRFSKMKYFLDLPEHIEEIICQGDFRAKRLASGDFQFFESSEAQFKHKQQLTRQLSLFSSACPAVLDDVELDEVGIEWEPGLPLV